MKKLLIFSTFIVTMFAEGANAQEFTIHRYASELKNRTAEEMKNLTDDDFRDGMTLDQCIGDLTSAINKSLKRSRLVKELDYDEAIQFTDKKGKTYLRHLFTEEMTRNMIKDYAFKMDGKQLGSVNTAGWDVSGQDYEMVWKERKPYAIGGVTEGAMAFDVGEYYNIPSLVGVQAIYQFVACLNPVDKWKYPWSKTEPQKQARPPERKEEMQPSFSDDDELPEVPPLPPCNLIDGTWKHKRMIEYHFFYLVKERSWYQGTTCQRDSLVDRDTVVRGLFTPAWFIGNIVSAGVTTWVCIDIHNANTKSGNGNNGSNNSSTTVVDSGTTNHHPTSGHKEADPHSLRPQFQNFHSEYYAYRTFGTIKPLKPVIQPQKPSVYFTTTVKLGLNDLISGKWNNLLQNSKLSFSLNTLKVQTP